MLCYHRTTEDAWEAIQKEGVLWGVTTSCRYTYLSPYSEIHESFGPVLLQVIYMPGELKDNYPTSLGCWSPPPGQTCWQFSVFEPISIARVTRMTKRQARKRAKGIAADILHHMRQGGHLQKVGNELITFKELQSSGRIYDAFEALIARLYKQSDVEALKH